MSFCPTLKTTLYSSMGESSTPVRQSI